MTPFKLRAEARTKTKNRRGSDNGRIRWRLGWHREIA